MSKQPEGCYTERLVVREIMVKLLLDGVIQRLPSHGLYRSNSTCERSYSLHSVDAQLNDILHCGIFLDYMIQCLADFAARSRYPESLLRGDHAAHWTDLTCFRILQASLRTQSRRVIHSILRLVTSRTESNVESLSCRRRLSFKGC